MTREEAILNLKVLKENCWTDDGYGQETQQYDDTISALDMAIQALEQEPKTGHWIDIIAGDTAICSCCNRLNVVYGTYCKHCGAKMEGGN